MGKGQGKGPVENAVRQRVITGARRYFFAHGLRSVTMDDLAEGLGMSKRTLYVHFPTKIALLHAVVLDKFRSIEEDLKRITSERSSRTPLDFSADVRRVLACLRQHGEEIRPPFLRDLQREAPEVLKAVENRRRELVQRYFGKLLREGQEAGMIRKDIPAELVIEILLGTVQGILHPSKMEELGLTPKTGFAAILTVILEGVITEKVRAKR